MANESHIELLLQGVDTWNREAKNLDFRADLSGVDVPKLFLTKGKLQPSNRLNLRGINFLLANLENTKFLNVDLSHSSLASANATKADFGGADLEGANLSGALLNDTNLATNLRGANLTGATLRGTKLCTKLFRATLTGANLSQSCPWTAVLFPEYSVGGIGNAHLQGESNIQSVGEMLEFCSDVKEHYQTKIYEDMKLYFRGESCDSWPLEPSIMRHNPSYVRSKLRPYEGEMLYELMSRHPAEFRNLGSAFSEWTMAQHHGLRTRLLDITANPLVALFHSSMRCQSNGTRGHRNEGDGVVHVFVIPKTLIRSFDSDAISVISNFAKLRKSEQDILLEKRKLKNQIIVDEARNYPEILARLYMLIRRDKPNFQERIDPRDFYRVCAVEPELMFERIRAQSGAFLLSAFHERFEPSKIIQWNSNTPIYTHIRIIIPSEDKAHLLNQLRMVNIGRESLFPGMDQTSQSIEDRVLRQSHHTIDRVD